MKLCRTWYNFLLILCTHHVGGQYVYGWTLCRLKRALHWLLHSDVAHQYGASNIIRMMTSGESGYKRLFKPLCVVFPPTQDHLLDPFNCELMNLDIPVTISPLPTNNPLFSGLLDSSPSKDAQSLTTMNESPTQYSQFCSPSRTPVTAFMWR